MKKALFVLEDLNGTGSPLTALHIVQNISDHVSVTILVLCAKSEEDILRKDAFKQAKASIIVKSMPHLFSRKFKLFYKFYINNILYTINKLNKKENFDYIYINRFNIAGPIFSWAKAKAKKTILIFNALGEVDLNYGNKRTSRLFNLSLMKTCDLCDYYLAISEQCFSKRYFIKGKKIIIQDYSDIPIKQDEKEFSKKQTIYIGQIGYYSKNKNQLFSLSLVKELAAIGFNVKIHLIGFPLDKEYYYCLLQYIKENGLHETVCFYDKEYDKLSFFDKIDILLIPSISEGFPLVIKEALSRKTPILGSNALPVEAHFDGLTRLSLQERQQWIQVLTSESYKKSIDTSCVVNDKIVFKKTFSSILK